MDQVRFRARRPLVMRLSAVPRGTRSLTSPVVASDGTVESAQLKTYLLDLAKDPVLREAVHVASGSLSRSLDELEAGRELSLKKLTSLAMSLSRYALRMESRSTPFGLFAGLTTVAVGASATPDDSGTAVRSVGLDGQWLHETVAGWLRDPRIRRRTKVMTNNLVDVRDGRAWLTWPVAGAPDSPEGAGARQETSVRLTTFVEWVLDRASVPVPFATLLSRAAEDFDGHSAVDLERVLSQLTTSGFLVTSLTPGKTGGDYWDRVTEAVAPDGGDAALLALPEWDEPEGSGPGRGRTAWDGALARLREISPDVTPQLRVDLRMPHRPAVPADVLREVEQYASSMWRIAPEAEPRPHLREYRERFKDRYGMGAAVALPDLVDPHRGLGYPRGYAGAAGPGDAVRPTATADRRALLGELVQEALNSGPREIRLTDAVLDELSDDSTAQVPLPTMELCLQVLAKSEQHLRDGDYRLLTPPFTGSWLAGASTARFADLLHTGKDLSVLLRSAAGPDRITAEVVFAPRAARALNVMQTPVDLLPFEIPLGVYADSRSGRVIDWRDLLVTATPSGLELIWGRTGQRVVPVVAHMLELESGAPDLARLLNDLALSQVKPWHAWRWAGLEALPALPRVTRGRTIVFPMRWKPSRHMRDHTSSWPEWNAALDAWRERYGVPDEVRVMHRDRAHTLDLGDEWHRKLLRNELMHNEISVYEDLTEGGTGLGWTNGHNNELVVPLVASAEEPAADRSRPPVPVRRARKTFHFPGGEWLYARFLVAPQRQNLLIGTHLPRLIRDVSAHIDNWFFIRYNDPEPHIRLRMRGRPAELAAHVLPALERHARTLKECGAIASVQLDTYEPEVQRYGGESAIALAEEVFAVDSQVAAAQVRWRLRTGRDAVPDEVLAAMNYATFLESLGPWDWASWIARTLLLRPEHAFFQRHRRLATQLVPPGRAAEKTAEVVGLPGLRDLWAQTPAVRAYGSFLGVDGPQAEPAPGTEDAILAMLHMQHNRLIGINAEKEKRSYAVLRGVAQAHAERVRRGFA